MVIFETSQIARIRVCGADFDGGIGSGHSSDHKPGSASGLELAGTYKLLLFNYLSTYLATATA